MRGPCPDEQYVNNRHVRLSFENVSAINLFVWEYALVDMCT